MTSAKLLRYRMCGDKAEIHPMHLETAYKLNVDVEKIEGDYFMVGDSASVVIHNLKNILKMIRINLETYHSALEFLNAVADYEIKPKVTYRIGARMGKPEGAKLREMKPAIHTLFPLGHDVGNQRKITRCY